MVNGVLVQNNPVNFIDPTGEIAIADDVVIAGTALAIATTAYLQSPQGQAAINNIYNQAHDLIDKILKDAQKNLDESKCETGTPWSGPGKGYDPDDPPPPNPNDPLWKKIARAVVDIARIWTSF